MRKLITNKRILIALACVLVVHSLFFAHKIKQSKHLDRVQNSQDKEKQKVIKISFKNKKKKQIVNSIKSKKDHLKKEKKFLSKDNNSFDRQTKSINIDRFSESSQGQKNGEHHLNKKNKVKKDNKIKHKKNRKNMKLADIGSLMEKQPESDIFRVKKGVKSSKKSDKQGANNDFIKDELPLGDLTRLNTQKYKYYGFYFRIRQKLEQFWGLSLKQKAEVLFKKGRSIARDQNMITNLEITINKSGKIINIKILGTSGIKELDDAAIESFNRAGPFPNPPKDLVQDGHAKINWGFVVTS